MKSTLKIKRDRCKVTIRKRPDPFTCLVYAGIFVCIVLFPIFFGEVVRQPVFIGLYTALIVGNIAMFVALFFGKITLDTDRRELCVYRPFPCKKTFDEVKAVRTYRDESDAEGSDIYKVIIVFTKGKEVALRTTSDEQSKELAEILKALLHSECESLKAV